MSTTMDQIAKDLSDMKRKPAALISDEQICRLIAEIAPQSRTSEELPDSAVHLLEELQNLPAELADKLRNGLLKGQQNSATIKDAFEEVLDRRNKAIREGEQDSAAKVTCSAVVPKEETLSLGELIILESLQDLKTKFSPFEAFTQTAQHLLLIAKALDTHVTKDPSPEHHDLLKRLNTIEHKLDVLLGTSKPLCAMALEARPRLDERREAPSTSLLFESCAVQDASVSAEQGYQATEQLIRHPDFAQLATPGPDATECDMDLITAQFPPLIPERNHAPSAISSDPIVGRSQGPEESRMPGQPEIEDFVALKRTPPTQTRSLDRFDGNRTTPSRKRRLIKFSSDDEEDGRETVKRIRSGLSLDEDDVGSFNIPNPIESDDAGKEEGSPGSSDFLSMTAEKPRNNSPPKTNSGLLQSRRRISVSPDLP
ncbi:hypothetical protein QFC21_003394 [Naganishia friedmannii]|uniref:Uncharacterized protein n=1 Tax=Naganishia friedmannii TaxID=89922 RepID=A0ACC2VR06_9TREE|nr:hypothetical protein QFC21_003394 [Naganishia friedmannii]